MESACTCGAGDDGEHDQSCGVYAGYEAAVRAGPEAFESWLADQFDATELAAMKGELDEHEFGRVLRQHLEHRGKQRKKQAREAAKAPRPNRKNKLKARCVEKFAALLARPRDEKPTLDDVLEGMVDADDGLSFDVLKAKELYVVTYDDLATGEDKKRVSYRTLQGWWTDAKKAASVRP